MKVLVTGGTGTVGSKVCRALSEKGITVVAGSRNNDVDLCKNSIAHKVFDFDAPSTYDEVLKDIDLIVLITPPLDLYMEDKVVQFIKHAKKLGKNNFVLLSLISIKDLPVHTMENVEVELRNSNSVYSIVRSNIFMDTFTNGFVSGMISQNKVIQLPAGDVEISMISSNDVAKAIAHVTCNLERHNGKTYTLTGSSSFNFEEAASIVSEIRNENIAFKNIQPTELKELANNNGLPVEITNVFLILFGASTLGLLSKTTNDFEKITSETCTDFGAFYQNFFDSEAKEKTI